MTEQQWLTSTDPQAMLRWLRQTDHPSDRWSLPTGYVPPSERKYRLFACACWRAYHAYWSERPRGPGNLDALLVTIEAAEQYADAPHAVFVTGDWPLSGPGERCASATVHRIGGSALAKHAMSALLRCIVGDPWQQPDLSGQYKGGDAFAAIIAGCQRVFAWQGGTIPRMAQTIYDEHRFEDLPVLADALEEAGLADSECDECRGAGWVPDIPPMFALNADLRKRKPCSVCQGARRIPSPILAHLRGPGPHARGCHVVDLLLGKE